MYLTVFVLYYKIRNVYLSHLPVSSHSPYFFLLKKPKSDYIIWSMVSHFGLYNKKKTHIYTWTDACRRVYGHELCYLNNHLIDNF